MDKDTRKQLEQLGWIQNSETTWTNPPKPYWNLHPRDKAMDVEKLAESLSNQYQAYTFSRGETHDGLTINTVINIFVKKEYENLLLAIEKAEEKRHTSFSAIYKGFKIDIHTEKETPVFNATISCDPNWPHLKYANGTTSFSLINTINTIISELLKIYIDSGKYPEI